MRLNLVIIVCLFLTNSLSAQSKLGIQTPFLDNFSSITGENYDIELIRKNNVSEVYEGNTLINFDSLGRLQKVTLFQPGASVINQTTSYRYNVVQNITVEDTYYASSKQTVTIVHFNVLHNNRVVIDSSGPSWCRHLQYSIEGQLQNETQYGVDHSRLLDTKIYYDSTGKIRQITSTKFLGKDDSIGIVITNRSRKYNNHGFLSEEIETVPWQANNSKQLLCPNAGSSLYDYDAENRVIKITRSHGPSQKIIYLANGLIDSIDSDGENCNGMKYHWHRVYKYSYFQRHGS